MKRRLTTPKRRWRINGKAMTKRPPASSGDDAQTGARIEVVPHPVPQNRMALEDLMRQASAREQGFPFGLHRQEGGRTVHDRDRDLVVARQGIVHRDRRGPCLDRVDVGCCDQGHGSATAAIMGDDALQTGEREPHQIGQQK